MDANLDCYDIFNDYLGLSSVVGCQEDPYLLMQSILHRAPQDESSLSVCNDETKTINLIHSDTTGLAPPAAEETVNGSSQPSSPLSDVERLFGRGATLQKKSPPMAQKETLSDYGGYCQSEGVASNQNWCPPVSNGHPVVGTCNSSNLQEITRESYIHSALDAILHKYNYIYDRQKAIENSNAARSPAPGKRLVEIASLTAALAKAAVSYNDYQCGANASPIYSGGYAVKKEEQHQQRKCDPQMTQNRFVGCSFCKNNKEVKEWFLSHQLKDSLGRVTCPVLRSYVCPLCDATGDNAHTVGHCPLNPDRRNSLPLAIRTKANATGKKKYLQP